MSNLFLDDEDYVPSHTLLHKQSEGKKKMRKSKELPTVSQRAIKSALNALTATGCIYKVITTTGEEIIHDPDNRLNKRKMTVNRDDLPYEYGDLKRHYAPYVQNMKVGDVVEIPFNDDLPHGAIQSSMSAHLSKVWGNGSYTTATNKTKKVIELLRIS
jgi:hypothetical protein